MQNADICAVLQTQCAAYTLAAGVTRNACWTTRTLVGIALTVWTTHQPVELSSLATISLATVALTKYAFRHNTTYARNYEQKANEYRHELKKVRAGKLTPTAFNMSTQWTKTPPPHLVSACHALARLLIA
jgi:predicted membrane chloride channel (bestrophin family)